MIAVNFRNRPSNWFNRLDWAMSVPILQLPNLVVVSNRNSVLVEFQIKLVWPALRQRLCRKIFYERIFAKIPSLDSMLKLRFFQRWTKCKVYPVNSSRCFFVSFSFASTRLPAEPVNKRSVSFVRADSVSVFISNESFDYSIDSSEPVLG